MQVSTQISNAQCHAPSAAFNVELGPIAHAVSRELCDQVPPERIEELLRELLEQEFSEARVTTFLPIFLHRFACDTLRAEAQARRRGAMP